MRDDKGRFSKAEGRPFKVGDRIRGKRLNGEILEGEITKITLHDTAQTYELGFGRWVSKSSAILLEPDSQPKPDDPKDAEIATLKAEVERLTANWKDAEAQLTETEHRLNTENHDLQAKLDDIRVIIRANEINLLGDTTPVSAIKRVLDREVQP